MLLNALPMAASVALQGPLSDVLFLHHKNHDMQSLLIETCNRNRFTSSQVANLLQKTNKHSAHGPIAHLRPFWSPSVSSDTGSTTLQFHLPFIMIGLWTETRCGLMRLYLALFRLILLYSVFLHSSGTLSINLTGSLTPAFTIWHLFLSSTQVWKLILFKGWMTHCSSTMHFACLAFIDSDSQTIRAKIHQPLVGINTAFHQQSNSPACRVNICNRTLVLSMGSLFSFTFLLFSFTLCSCSCSRSYF